MAGKKGKKTKVKAKAIPLSEFLGAGAGIGPDATVVSAPKVKYDEDDREEIYGNEQILLPTCPRTSRGPHVDTEQIPTTGPFTAHVANLPFEVDEYDIRKFFADLPIVNVRLPMDRDGIRMKGYGYVEFETRSGLIDAISLHEEMMKGRKIRVDLPENEGREGDRGGRDGYRREGGGSRYGDRDGGRGEDREERSLAVSDWRNAPPAERDESRAGGGGGGSFGDRDRGGGGGGGFGERDRGGFGDRDRGSGFGDRDRDRGGGGGFSDRDRGGGGFENRDRGGGRFGGGGSRFDDDRRGGGGAGGGDRGPSRSDDEPWRRGGAGGGSSGGFSDRKPGGGFDDRYGDRDRSGGGGGGGFSDRKPGGGFDDRHGDRDRSGGGGGGGGYDRTEERRPRAGGLEHSDEPAKERPRLQLKPRSVPAASDGGPVEVSSGPASDAHDEAEALSGAPSAAAAASSSGGAGSSIFGSARPVDTAAREKELLDRTAKKSPLVPKRESPKASSADIFGAAKPVDTAARELAIEQKIASGISPVIPKKAPMPASKTDIFGAARPVDTTSREREIEEKLRTRVPAAADSAPPVRDTWRDRGTPKETSGYGGGRDAGGGGYGGRGGDSGRGGRDLGASRGGGGDYDRRDRFRDGGRGGGGDYPRGGDMDRDGYRNGRLEGRGNYGSREGSRDGYTSARIGDSERRNGVEKSQPERVAAPVQVERPDDYDSDEERFKKAQPKGKDVPSTLNVKNKFANLDLEEDLP